MPRICAGSAIKLPGIGKIQDIMLHGNAIRASIKR
jgi:hypothetical protein